MDWQHIKTTDGTVVPLQTYPATGEKRATFLMLPALGIAARFYRRLAKGLADNGIETILFEQRGHGESPYRAKRGDVFGYDAFLNNDIPAALDWVQARAGNKPVYLGGHSLGGHFSSILAGRRPGEFAGVVHLACGFPHHRLYEGASIKKIKTLCAILPVVTKLWGYFPGNRFGFGGREYRQVMLDWRDWALKGSYDYGAHSGIEAEIASYTGRVLSLSFEGDFFASDAAIIYSHSRLANAQVTAKKLGPLEQGKHLGHFDWARNPVGVVAELAAWMA